MNAGPQTVDEAAKEMSGSKGGNERSRDRSPRSEFKFSDPIEGLILKYGAPAYFNSRGKLERINQPFWAALHASENDVIFDAILDQFFAYDQTAGIYGEQSVDAIRKRVAGRMFEAEHTWKGYPRLSEQRTEKAIAGIIAHLRGEVEEVGAFSRNSNLLHLANCSIRVDLDGSIVEPVSRLQRARWRSPIVYDPKAKCPRFLEMLLAPLDPEQKIVLQKMFGLFLTGQNPAHKILILDGEGGSGKSTVALVFQELLGPKRTGSLRTKYLEDRFEIGRFYEKTLLIGADVLADFLQKEAAGAIKKLTGGDYLEAEHKSSNRVIELYGRFNCIITANVRLKIRLQNDASAWLRRLVLIRYNRGRQNQRILDFHKILVAEEGAGILNWGLEGVRLLKGDIESTGDLVLSPSMQQVIRALVEESDGLRLFLRANVAQREGCDLSGDEIIKAFSKHCQRLGWIIEPVGTLQRQLESLMVELFGSGKRNDIGRDGKDLRGYAGVRFRNANDEEGMQQ